MYEGVKMTILTIVKRYTANSTTLDPYIPQGTWNRSWRPKIEYDRRFNPFFFT